MKKTTALILVSLCILLPMLAAGMTAAEAESYATPLPGEVEQAAPFSIDLTPLLQAAIALCAALITGKLIPWIRSKTSEKQFANLEAAARVAVFAAEQIYGAAEGDAKLEYAIAKLKEQGFALDFDLLREAVESAVYDMNFVKRMDAREEEREARKIDAAKAKGEVTDTGRGMVLLTPLEKWTPELLGAFCRMEDIPCENCVTREEYIDAIHRASLTSGADAPGEAPQTAAPEAPAAPGEAPQTAAPEAPAAPEADSEAPVSEAE